MAVDRQRLRHQLRRAGGRGAIRRLQSDIERSRERRARRHRALPRPAYPPELPITAERARISRAIAGHQVTVVCGETGSGKTTQLPKICLELGRGVDGLIGHTQPRRIAARSVAARVAQELQSELGRMVGYQVRFTGRVSSDAYVKLMTDGILLAEIQRDRELRAYDTLIIDEAHERSLNVDFLLGYLKRLLPRRPELKVIVTSATIDPQRFSQHFGDAPVIEIPGRGYPVQTRYRPVEREGGEERELDAAVADAVEEALEGVPGDVLVFLPGEREIRESAEALRKRRLPGVELMPLYARLSAAQQDRVFAAHRERRVVLATNVAETSLTVPNIGCVVDSGLARVSRYSYRSKVQRLPVERIPRASAEQRKGRCGRIGPGVCIRLYGREDLEARPPFAEPEIQRTSLASVILQMKALRLGEIEDFPFLDAPDRRLVSDGQRLLRELGALDERGRLTPTGRRLARMPVDPRIGRMILAGAEEGCLDEVLVVAAALSIPDPRERPMEAREAAERAHARFRDPRSDFVALLNLWRYFHQQQAERSGNQLRRHCRELHLSWMRMREWQDVYAQLRQIAREMGLRGTRGGASPARLHRALLSGLASHIGARADEREYLGARNARFRISPGSGVHGSGARWVVAAELVETTQLYAHTVARVRPEWIQRAASHLVKRTYFEPHWDATRAEVYAYERVTLYGLTLISRRRVRYAPLNPGEARALFIQAALVEGRYQTDAPWHAQNRALLAELRALEHKTRRADLLVDDAAIHAFYAERVPGDVASGESFEAWRQRAEAQHPRILFLEREHLLRDPGIEVSPAAFPDTLEVSGQGLPLSYRFEPGHEADGVTLTVPVALLNQLDPRRMEWLVPGLLREKVIALLRILPKGLRKTLVPLPDFADACLAELAPADEPLTDALARVIQRRAGLEVTEDAWDVARLPEPLRLRYRVLGANGEELAVGRDLACLQRRFGRDARRTFRSLPAPAFERTGLRSWSFGELPRLVEFESEGVRYAGHPALVDESESVGLRLADTPETAARETRRGLRRLFKLQIPGELKRLRQSLPGLQRMCLAYALVPPPAGAGEHGRRDACEALREELMEAIVDRAFLGDAPDIRTAQEFERRRRAGTEALARTTEALCALVASILEAYRRARTARAEADPGVPSESLRDIDEQLSALVYRGFVLDTPYPRLEAMPRYLRALAHRMARIRRDPARDAARARELRAFRTRYLERVRAHRARSVHDPELDAFRWMLEELRVSYFAQELGTAYPVSVKRLERQWERVKR